MSPRGKSPTRPKGIAGIGAGFIALAFAAGIAGAAMTTPAPPGVTPAAATVTAEPASTRDVAPTPPPLPPTTFTMVAAGDVLPHAPVVDSATTSAGINFVPLMEPVRAYIEGADLALCHMEVPVAPPGTEPSGYPMFGSPSEMVRDLDAIGWDGCSTASNHSVDRKAAGIAATLEQFDAFGMGATGTARTEAEATTTQMYVVHGVARDVKVAHISFAYDSLNGLPKPQGQPWAVNTFSADAADASPVIAAAGLAREQGADIVIASVHCCIEYETTPRAPQRSVAEQIAASELVDVYVGHHSHVPQPIEKLPGGVNGDGMWVAFGLGNFLSNQDTQCCAAETNSGVLLTTTFTVDDEGRVDTSVEWTAITVDRLGSHTMHVLNDVPGGAGRLSAAEVAARHARVAAAVGPSAPERAAPAQPLSLGVDTILRSASAVQ